MKILINIDNQDRKTTMKITSEMSLGKDDFIELRDCLCNIFRCNEKEVKIEIPEL